MSTLPARPQRSVREHSQTPVITTAATDDQVRAVLWQEIRASAGQARLPKPLRTQWMIDDVLVAIGRKF
jgi:hypothetical protein